MACERYNNITADAVDVLCCPSQDYLTDIPPVVFWCRMVLLTTCCSLGMVGNCLAFLVYCLHERNTTVAACIRAKTAWDTLVLLTCFLFIALPEFLPSMTSHDVLIPLIYSCSHISRTASVWTSTMMSMERFWAVWYPLRYQQLCSYRRAQVALLVISAAAVAFCMPKFFDIGMTVRECVHNDTGVVSTFGRIEGTELRHDPTYKLVYIGGLVTVCLYAAPFLTIFVMNMLIYVALRKAYAQREKLTRKNQRELSTSLMLYIETAVFLLCNILPLGINIMESTHLLKQDEDWPFILVDVSNLLVTVYPASNFFVFYIFGSKFRSMFRRTYFFWRREEFDPLHRQRSFYSSSNHNGPTTNSTRLQIGQKSPSAWSLRSMPDELSSACLRRVSSTRDHVRGQRKSTLRNAEVNDNFLTVDYCPKSSLAPTMV